MLKNEMLKREYLSKDSEYRFEKTLDGKLFVFRKKCDVDENEYEYCRCVINMDGNILLKEVYGDIYFSRERLVVVRNDEIDIIGVVGDVTINMRSLKEDGKMITKLKYCNDSIIMIRNNLVKIFDVRFRLLREVYIDSSVKILDCELSGDSLKILIANDIDAIKYILIDLTNVKVNTFDSGLNRELKEEYFIEENNNKRNNLVRRLIINTQKQ